MLNLDNTLNKYQTDIDDVNKWADSEYNKYFFEHFKDVNRLHDKLKSNNDPITDEELEWILTWLPLELMSVSEKLSQLKNTQEVIKLGIKQEENKTISNLIDEGLSATKAKEVAASETSSDKLLVSIYDSIYDRVLKQSTFAKELIMSSKKIWDARRNSEQSMPSIPSEDVQALPDYNPGQKPSTYIK